MKIWKTYFQIKRWFPTPGVEPGPSGWKPDILAVRPRGIMFPSGIEPETFCVLGRCDNRYTTETCSWGGPVCADPSAFLTFSHFWITHSTNTLASVSSRDRLVVRTLRCGRSNPGSNPGHDRIAFYPPGGWKDACFPKVPTVSHCAT